MADRVYYFLNILYWLEERWNTTNNEKIKITRSSPFLISFPQIHF